MPLRERGLHKKRIVLAVLLCGVGFVTTVGGIVATHKEILRYLEMPESRTRRSSWADKSGDYECRHRRCVA